MLAEDWRRAGHTNEGFGSIVGLSKRTMDTMSTGGRVGVRTYHAVAAALGWAPGSVDKVLSGGEPTRLESTGWPSAAQRAAEARKVRLLEVWDSVSVEDQERALRELSPAPKT